MVVHGRDMLTDSPAPTAPLILSQSQDQDSFPPPKQIFEWDKLVKLLEDGLKFKDFRESLIVNYHMMVEDQTELNEGLKWYKRTNEVVVAKIDNSGNPPAKLVARMKLERKALREKVLREKAAAV